MGADSWGYERLRDYFVAQRLKNGSTSVDDEFVSA